MSKKKVFVLGDSISIHYGPYLSKYIEPHYNYHRKGDIVKALLNLDKPQGANGGDSDQVYEYLKEEIDNLKWDILLLNCGLHDIRTDETGTKQISKKKYEQNLQGICSLVKNKGLTVWINTTPVDDLRHNARDVGFKRYDEDVIIYNRIASEVMRQNNTKIIDLYTFTKTLGKTIYIDHVHFTKLIRKCQASFIAGYLNSL